LEEKVMKQSIAKYITTTLGVASFAALATLASAQASLPLYEPFNYPDGNLAGNSIGGATWAHTGGGTQTTFVQVSAGSLSYPGLPAPTGGKVTLLSGSNYDDPGLDIATQTAGTVYASFVMNVVSPISLAAGEYVFAFLSQGASNTNYRARVFVAPGGTPGTFKPGLRFTNSDPIQYGSDLPLNTPVFVVVAYNFNAGGDDTASLWINPALGQPAPPTPDLTATAAGADLTSLGRILLRQPGGTGQNVQIDEIRVDTSWTSVTPNNASVQDWSLY
jgi:hypothetical protein